MKNKKNVIIIVLIVVLLIIGIIFGSSSRFVNSTTKLCQDIQKYQDSKESFLIRFELESSDPQQIELFNRISNEYQNIKIITTSHSNIESKCLKEKLIKDDVYNWLKNVKNPAFIAYKDGKYVGGNEGYYDYYLLEGILDDYKVIKKKEIKEKITFDSFKNSIKDRYILIMQVDDSQRQTIETNASKYFTDIDYDIVFASSKVGKKIFKYIDNNYKINNVYPKAMYFHNSKLIEESEVYDIEDDYIQFYESIQNK